MSVSLPHHEDQSILASLQSIFISARYNIYISRLCYDVSVRLFVRLSVTEEHWRIIANLSFKFRSQFTLHYGRGACGRDRAREGIIAGKSGVIISRMLATARPSCFNTVNKTYRLHLRLHFNNLLDCSTGRSVELLADCAPIVQRLQ